MREISPFISHLVAMILCWGRGGSVFNPASLGLRFAHSPVGGRAAPSQLELEYRPEVAPEKGRAVTRGQVNAGKVRAGPGPFDPLSQTPTGNGPLLGKKRASDSADKHRPWGLVGMISLVGGTLTSYKYQDERRRK